MMTLQNQPTAWPTRKIAAVLISGAILGAVQSGLQLFWPDHPFSELMTQFDVWIQTAVMFGFGYMVREKSDT